MTVSNEDREAAWRGACDEIDWDDMVRHTPGDESRCATLDVRTARVVRRVVDHLVSHGWGPRPRAAIEASANECHCPENGLIERDTCDRGHCRSCHTCYCDAQADGHGWEPRPRVMGTAIDEFLALAAGTPLTASRMLKIYLRECGVEVLSDDG